MSEKKPHGLALVLTCSLALSLQPRAPSSADASELNRRHGFALESAADAPLGVEPATLEKIARGSGLAKKRLAETRVFTAERKTPEGALQPLTGATLALEPAGELALLVAADGVVESISLVGYPPMEQSKSSDWRGFLQQLKRNRQGCKTLGAKSVRTREERQTEWKTLLADKSPRAEMQRALYRQRLLMRENSRRFTLFNDWSKKNELPTVKWVNEWTEVFDELARNGKLMKEATSPEIAERYEESATTCRDLMRQASAALAAGQKDDFASILGSEVYDVGCTGCHSIPAGQGVLLYDSLLHGLEEHGVRKDFLLVDVDLWGVPGQTRECQVVADHVYALLAVLGTRQ